MRGFLVSLLVLVMLVFGGALMAEGWLAGRVAALAERDPRVTLATSEPLREGTRLGIRLTGLAVQTAPDAAVRLPSLDLWARPLSPTDFHATLPETVDVDTPNGALALDIQDGQLRLRLAPLNGMAVSDAGVSLAALSLAGRPAADALSVAATLTGLGSDAPMEARAAYDVAVQAARIDPAALVLPGVGALPPLPESLSASGSFRLWLDAAPGQEMWRNPPPAPPQLVGLRLDGVRIGAEDMNARFFGRLTRGADGLAQGRIAVLTADAAGFLAFAADSGLIPRAGRFLGMGLVAGIAAQPLPEPVSDWPQPENNEVLLPVILRDGQVFLGELPVGPAPHFPGGMR